LAENLAKDPIRAGQFLTSVIALAGALPIKVGDDVIDAIGVPGGPGGEKASIDKVANQFEVDDNYFRDVRATRQPALLIDELALSLRPRWI
jgi:hypothetical protein